MSLLLDLPQVSSLSVVIKDIFSRGFAINSQSCLLIYVPKNYGLSHKNHLPDEYLRHTSEWNRKGRYSRVGGDAEVALVLVSSIAGGLRIVDTLVPIAGAAIGSDGNAEDIALTAKPSAVRTALDVFRGLVTGVHCIITGILPKGALSERIVLSLSGRNGHDQSESPSYLFHDGTSGKRF
ncbi:hypothetical protein N7447_002693 [Penicillium robsamsonii]|uniref:uncharacterized protein n=1 Tax=Penicillium robsamsonii TaxID=1792511 RepID=UPI0025483826|nr:uncharacterized protein N7447_002693 [Penicillium robsamsonii]KAJ5836667.1 hypothetical protein N7447_002693 [Penicillium robsamsonii]